MIVTAIRSSLSSGYQWCSFKSLLNHNVGLRDKPNKKATKGSCVHKALELLAKKKLARQEGVAFIHDEELNQSWTQKELSLDCAVACAYKHYHEPDWTEKDQMDCWQWTKNVVEWDNGAFHPENLDIVAPELHFDFLTEESWGRYHYKVQGKVLTGQLRLYGTMDLIFREGPGVLHYCDWKTGRRFDWEKKRAKSYEELQDDFQFLLYYFALSKLFPDETILFTVFYVNDGGPVTLNFTKAHLALAQQRIKDIFLRIKEDDFPSWVRPSWKCKICAFNEEGEAGQSICENYRQELVQLGMPKFLEKHANVEIQGRYLEGGGSSLWDSNEKRR